MHNLLQAKLEEAIQSWADNNCESIEWPQDILTGEDTVYLMAMAAGAVFEAVVESQRSAVREGMLAEV
jgi:hypothetical protein